MDAKVQALIHRMLESVDNSAISVQVDVTPHKIVVYVQTFYHKPSRMMDGIVMPVMGTTRRTQEFPNRFRNRRNSAHFTTLIKKCDSTDQTDDTPGTMWISRTHNFLEKKDDLCSYLVMDALNRMGVKL